MKYKYSFDDEPVQRFEIDFKFNKTKLFFDSFFMENEEISEPCVFIIDSWKSAYVQEGDDPTNRRFSSGIGIPYMIFDITCDGDDVELFIQTCDVRLQYWLFRQASLRVEIQ